MTILIITEYSRTAHLTTVRVCQYTKKGPSVIQKGPSTLKGDVHEQPCNAYLYQFSPSFKQFVTQRTTNIAPVK